MQWGYCETIQQMALRSREYRVSDTTYLLSGMLNSTHSLLNVVLEPLEVNLFCA